MPESWEPKSDNSTIRNLKRIEKDIADIVKNPPPGIIALPDEEDIKLVHLMIVGPKDTPYQGGLFRFLFDFTSNYPMKAPKVKLMTTGNGTVRFNPNLYSNGKVCLSILGTWDGPGWTPIYSLSAVAVSIQSLMNDKPYCNEPAYEKCSDKKTIDSYNKRIQYETIRIAVIDVLEKLDSYPEHFHQTIKDTIAENHDYFMEVCKSNLDLDGKYMTFGKGFNFKVLHDKLLNLKFD